MRVAAVCSCALDLSIDRRGSLPEDKLWFKGIMKNQPRAHMGDRDVAWGSQGVGELVIKAGLIARDHYMLKWHVIRFLTSLSQPLPRAGLRFDCCLLLILAPFAIISTWTCLS